MKKIFMFSVFLALTMLMVGTVQAAAYIKFDGVDGESKDRDHEGWIDVLSVDWGMNKPNEGATGQSRRRGSVVVEDVVLVKELDKSSPKLQEKMLMGEVIPKLEIEMTETNSDGTQQPYLKIVMEDVIISSYQTSANGDSDDRPTEEVAFYYNKISYHYMNDGGIFSYIWNFLTGRGR
jgi:type VI secretion system secreted protein Hcp